PRGDRLSHGLHRRGAAARARPAAAQERLRPVPAAHGRRIRASQATLKAPRPPRPRCRGDVPPTETTPHPAETTPPMNIVPTALPEVLVIEPKVFGDDRGYFFESFNARRF